MYKCNRCGSDFCSKQSLTRHLLKEKKCPPENDDIDPNILLSNLISRPFNDVTYDCEHCGKKFNSQSNKSRHLKTCKAFLQAGTKIDQMQKEINELKEVIKDINPQNHIVVPQNQTNMNQCTVNNVQNNNITITNFGSENLEFLSDKFIRKCLLKMSSGLEDLTRKIHFNPDKPEYHNITASNKKDSFLEVYKDGKWQYQDKNKTLDSIINRCVDMMSSHYDDFEGEIKSELSSLHYKHVDQFIENALNKDKSTQNDLRKCLYMLILNNRHVVKKDGNG